MKNQARRKVICLNLALLLILGAVFCAPVSAAAAEKPSGRAGGSCALDLTNIVGDSETPKTVICPISEDGTVNLVKAIDGIDISKVPGGRIAYWEDTTNNRYPHWDSVDGIAAGAQLTPVGIGNPDNYTVVLIDAEPVQNIFRNYQIKISTELNDTMTLKEFAGEITEPVSYRVEGFRVINDDADGNIRIMSSNDLLKDYLAASKPSELNVKEYFVPIVWGRTKPDEDVPANTIRFYGNGGVTEGKTEYVDLPITDGSITMPESQFKYTLENGAPVNFICWATSPLLGAADYYNAGQAIAVDESTPKLLYAIWQDKSWMGGITRYHDGEESFIRDRATVEFPWNYSEKGIHNFAGWSATEGDTETWFMPGEELPSAELKYRELYAKYLGDFPTDGNYYLISGLCAGSFLPGEVMEDGENRCMAKYEKIEGDSATITVPTIQDSMNYFGWYNGELQQVGEFVDNNGKFAESGGQLTVQNHDIITLVAAQQFQSRVNLYRNSENSDLEKVTIYSQESPATSTDLRFYPNLDNYSGEKIFAGGPQNSKPFVGWNTERNGTGKMITKPEDSNFIYDEDHVSYKLDVYAQWGIDLSNAVVTLNKTVFAQTAAEKIPTVASVVLGDKTLTKDTDYTVVLPDPAASEPGEYTVKVIGKGDYAGSASATFRVNKVDKVKAPEGVQVADGETAELEIEHGISGVSDALQALGYGDLTKLEAALHSAISGTTENTAVFDVKLMIQKTADNVTETASAGESNFPADGKLTITLPYPEAFADAANWSNYSFTAVHMFANTLFGKTPGGTEILSCTPTASGIQLTVTGLSPIAVKWTKNSTSVAPPVTQPAETPSPSPTASPSPSPSAEPTAEPTTEPTSPPTTEPTTSPTTGPTATPVPVIEVTPDVKVDEETGAVTAEVPAEKAEGIIEAAKKEDGANVVVKVEAPAGSNQPVNEAAVSLPAKTVEKLGTETTANIKVETPVAAVTVSQRDLANLGSGAESVTVSVKKDTEAGTIQVEVKKDNEAVKEIALKAEVPSIDDSALTPTTVAVIVDANGKETIVPKSMVNTGSNSITILLKDGSSTIKLKENKKDFTDTIPTWAEKEVDFVTSRGLYSGTSEGVFNPTAPMNRAMLVQVLYNLESRPATSADELFGDVDQGKWYTKAVAWGKATGIVAGVSPTNFAPNREVTREQLALILYNFAKKSGMNVSKSASTGGFNDAGQVHSWADKAMQWAVGNRIIGGKDDGSLDPRGSATRAQVAVMITRFTQVMTQ